jgi:predicted secreted hydrolase
MRGRWTVDGNFSRFALTRRRLLASLGTLVALPATAAAPPTAHRPPPTPFAKVVPGYRIRFPEDEGAHPDFRLEWWYITGWLSAAAGPLGFQVTFFRVRPALRHANPSAFTPRQIVVAHAALSDPSHRRLAHSQRAARAGFGLAGAETGRTRVWIDDWALEQEPARYRCRIPAAEVHLDLEFEATQPPLLQGDAGYSRKGPLPASASYYYSLPQLRVQGSVARGSQAHHVTGRAWLDHEWSTQYMEEAAAGWDWIGINLDDGGALMAFRMRRKDGGAFWAGGTLRRADGALRTFAPQAVRFIPRREWRSPRSGASYPVAWRVELDGVALELEPLFDDQEHDSRATVGAIYWEGAVRALRDGKAVGLGYLELTGYGRRIDL